MASTGSTAEILPIVWELSKFYTALVNTWLLREFHTRGAPPIQSDLELVAKLSTALEAFQNQAREISTNDVKETGAHKEVLQRIQGMQSVPLNLRERARYLLRRINWPDGWPKELNRCRCSKHKPAEKPIPVKKPILLGDLSPEPTVHYQSILFMSEYQNISSEEMRLADYALGLRYRAPGDTEFVAYKATEQNAYTVYTTYHFQNILFKDPYKSKSISLEELRLADYTGGRKYGTEKTYFEAYQETDINPGYTSFTFHNIFSKLSYRNISPEELRLVDYARGRKYGTGEIGISFYKEVWSCYDEELVALTEDTLEDMFVTGSKKEGKEGKEGNGDGDEGNQEVKNNEQDSVTSKKADIQKKDTDDKQVEEENNTFDEKKLMELSIREKGDAEKNTRGKEVDNSSNINESENQGVRSGECVHTTLDEKKEEHDKVTKGDGDVEA